MRLNQALHAKLDRQIREHRDSTGADPSVLHLTHDEIDEWRAQFDGTIPVASLAYRHIPIAEAA